MRPMEGDTGCLWDQPWNHVGGKMVGKGHQGNFSHLATSPLAVLFAGGHSSEESGSRSHSSVDRRGIPGAGCRAHLLFLDPFGSLGCAACMR